MILVDTSVWIEFLRGRDTIHRRMLHDLIEADEDLCMIAAIAVENKLIVFHNDADFDHIAESAGLKTIQIL